MITATNTAEMLDGLAALKSQAAGTAQPGLQDALKAVQYLKSQHYIGTGDAYKIVRAVSAPAKLADSVNENMSGTASYKATAERVAGLGAVWERTYLGARPELTPDVLEEIDRIELPFLRSLPHSTPNSRAMYSGSDVQNAIDGIWASKDDLVSIFSSANSLGITKDLEFGGAFAAYIDKVLFEEYEKAGSDFARSAIKRFRDHAIPRLLRTRWDYELSKDKLWDYASEAYESLIPLDTAARRLQKDGTGHDIGNRRRFLANFISRVPERIKDYRSLMRFLDVYGPVEKDIGQGRLRNVLKRSKVVEYPLPLIDFGSKLGFHNDVVGLFRYARRAIASEGRFVEKLLESRA